MNVTVNCRGLKPNQIAINRFMSNFQRVRIHMMTHLLATQKEVNLVAYNCGSVLYLDIIYNIVAHGENYHLEFTIQIESNTKQTIYLVRRLFGMVLHDAITPDDVPFTPIVSLL